MYPYQPLTRGERAGSGGILHAQEFVNSGSAIGIMECGGEASAHAKADASALQRLGVRSPLPHRVGEGQGG